MRRIVFIFLLSCTLLANPALASGTRPPIYRDIGRNFRTGATFYLQTLDGWFMAILSRLGWKTGASTLGEGTSCLTSTPCAPGLTCLNTCDDQDCRSFTKRCAKGIDRLAVLGEFSPCSNKDLCADGTECTRVCPTGATCSGPSNVCLKPPVPAGSCTSDADCVAVCGQSPFPPIGPAALAARCVQGACTCTPFKIEPSAERVACPEGSPGPIDCPVDTHAACARLACTDGNCPIAGTCLTAPAYGGACLDDAECASAECPQGAEAFCANDDRRCKCRTQDIRAIPCQSAADCGDPSLCSKDEIRACVNGACACAPNAPAPSACRTVSDCSEDCPPGYAPGCDRNACVCQKTRVAPVACRTSQDCGSVSCPDGYDKACNESVCACTRQVQP